MSSLTERPTLFPAYHGLRMQATQVVHDRCTAAPEPVIDSAGKEFPHVADHRS